MTANGFDMTCKVTGGGYEMEVTWGGYPERPGADEQAQMKRICEQQFPVIFNEEYETSAVTVGPIRHDGDGDHQVG